MPISPRLLQKKRAGDQVSAADWNLLVGLVKREVTGANVISGPLGWHIVARIAAAGAGAANVAVVRVSTAVTIVGTMGIVVQTPLFTDWMFTGWNDTAVTGMGYVDPAATIAGTGAYADLYSVGSYYFAVQLAGKYFVISGASPDGHTGEAKYVERLHVDEDGCIVGVDCTQLTIRGGLITARTGATGCWYEV